jgi:hypothetical protein
MIRLFTTAVAGLACCCTAALGLMAAAPAVSSASPVQVLHGRGEAWAINQSGNWSGYNIGN